MSYCACLKLTRLFSHIVMLRCSFIAEVLIKCLSREQLMKTEYDGLGECRVLRTKG